MAVSFLVVANERERERVSDKIDDIKSNCTVEQFELAENGMKLRWN